MKFFRSQSNFPNITAVSFGLNNLIKQQAANIYCCTTGPLSIPLVQKGTVKRLRHSSRREQGKEVIIATDKGGL